MPAVFAILHEKKSAGASRPLDMYLEAEDGSTVTMWLELSSLIE